MKWVTRSHIHVDRAACPWLISRFVDARAEFLFVADSEVRGVSETENATAFDAPGVELGHRDGHCSFVSIVQKYGLMDPGLLLMADVVDAADTGRLDANPLARGLKAIAQGFSLRFPDDRENLAHQFPMYDALYAFLRLEASRRKDGV